MSSEALETRVKDAMPSALQEALETDVGALLLDADVSAVLLRETGFRVCRRGRWEPLAAKARCVFDALYSYFMDNVIAADVVLHFELVKGGRLTALFEGSNNKLKKGELPKKCFLVASLQLPPRRARSLQELVREGMLDSECVADILQATSNGAHFWVLGPSAAGANRLLWAVVAELESGFSFGAKETLGLPHVFQISSVHKSIELGLEASIVMQQDVEELVELLPQLRRHGVFSTLELRSVSQLNSFLKLDSAAQALNAVVVVMGKGPSGVPCIVELHLPQTSTVSTDLSSEPMTLTTRGSIDSSSSSSSSSSIKKSRMINEAKEFALSEVDFRRAEPEIVVADCAQISNAQILEKKEMFTIGPLQEGLHELPPLLPLPDAPPDDWDTPIVANDIIGFSEDKTSADSLEMHMTSSKGASFASTLAQVRNRPGFRPNAPCEHPQSAALKKDPFGGLSLEPPFSDDDVKTEKNDSADEKSS